MSDKPLPKENIQLVINASMSASAIAAVTDIYKESLLCFTDYMKCREHEITERARISACLAAIVEKIAADKEMYMKTLEMNFNERTLLYDKVNETIAVANDHRDTEMLKLAYNFMLTVFQGGIQSTNKLSDNIFSNDKVINFLK